MCEAVVVCRPDRHFVEMFSVEHPAFDARDFRARERGFSFEICGAMQRPYVELAVMVVKRGKMLLSLFGRSCFPGGSMRQGGIEAKIPRFHLR